MKRRWRGTIARGGAAPAALFSVVALALLAGCGGGGSREATPEEIAEERMSVKSLDEVRRAAAISLEIEVQPQRAAEILQRHGLSRQDYDAMMFEISADPRLSEAYEEALDQLEAENR